MCNRTNRLFRASRAINQLSFVASCLPSLFNLSEKRSDITMEKMDFCMTSILVSIISGGMLGLVTFLLFVLYWFGSRSNALYDSLTPPGSK